MVRSPIHKNCINLAMDLHNKFVDGFELMHYVVQNKIIVQLGNDYVVIISIPEINQNMVGSPQLCEAMGIIIEVEARIMYNDEQVNPTTYILNYDADDVCDFCIRMRDAYVM